MAGRIPQSFINELLARADLVDVIESRITLKKSGQNYSACCPFHNEKTPSFSVNPDKQFYYCFGCGASGNALTFLMEYEGQEFVAAIEDLAAQMSMTVPREAYSGEKPPPVDDLFPLMESVSNYYQQQLKSNPAAKKAVDYLKKRGLTGEIAKQYAIGYAPDEWQNLNQLEHDPKKLQQDLVDTGMMIQKENGHAYDRFRDRIMFPIRNRRGQILGFGGRIIDQGEPKYLNSPETKLFHKGKELYGLFEMRRQLRNIEHVIIVEGYMDVVALAQFGIYNATATLGTATTSDHLHTLFRICSKIVFCFDGDKAGRAAALRALNHALPLLKDTREIRLMFLPEGEDPDTMVRNVGAENFKQQVESSVTLFDYLISYLTSQVNMKTFEGPARLVHLAKPYFLAIKDPILSVRFQIKLSELSGLTEKQLVQVLQETPDDQAILNKPATPPIKKPHISQQHSNQKINPVQANIQEIKIPSASDDPKFKRSIALILQFPDALPPADLNWLKEIDEPGAKILHALCQLIQQSENISTGILIENWREKPEEPNLSRLATIDLHVAAENVQIELCEIFKRLEKNYLEEQCNYFIEKSKTQHLDPTEKNALKRLLKAKSSF